MPHVTLKEILADARRKKYGIPCLLGGNLEMITGQVRAAEDRNSPLILCYNRQLTPGVPMELTVPLMINAAERSKVPVSTILDHASEYGPIIQALRLGISSVMFDGSSLKYSENVHMSREIVKIAHAAGVSVEAELGYVGGSALERGEGGSLNSTFTRPGQVADFVEETDVDALAISFGNSHGSYRGVPLLDLKRVKDIHDNSLIPLVMHGGSGLSSDDYKKIVASGVSKVNYYSDMSMGAVKNLKELTAKDEQYPGFHSIIKQNTDYFHKETQKLLDVLGCSGKAGNQ